ncbi:site-specific integrase, partial [Acinetobacter baumannii]
MTLLVTKNGYARTVPMRPEVFDLLSRLGPRRTGSVFGCTSASIGTAFGRIKSRAGLEDLRFHDLRHEATSRL